MITLRKWKGFFKRDVSDVYPTIKVRAPRNYFKRADVFIEDIIYTTNKELFGINKSFLIKLLFDNFLDHVRQGKDMYDYVLNLKETYSDVLVTVNKLNSPNSSLMPKFQWNLSNKSNRTEESDYLTLNLKLHPREVNRIEVLFSDLDWKYDHPLDMELNELISLLFIEFITELRNGFDTETKAEIIASILDKWEERSV